MIDQLREAIRNSGYSLYRLEKVAGLPTGQLCRFMRGRRTLMLLAAEKLCRVLGLTLVSARAG